MSRDKTVRLYRTVLDGIQERMRQSIDLSRQVLDHAGEKGASIERVVRSGLRDILPEKIGVTHGFVIDSLGGRSKQMDIILYDRLNAPRFFPLPGIQVLPVETTYACGEVKAQLDGTALRDCLDKCSSYKALERAAYVGTPSPISTEYSLFGGKHEHWQSIFFCIAGSATDVDRLTHQYRRLVLERSLSNNEGIDTLLSLESNGRCNLMLNVSGLEDEGVPSNRSINLLPSPNSRPMPYRAKAPWALFVHLLLPYMAAAPVERVNLLKYSGPNPF